MSKSVGVVVPCKNEAATIGECLESLRMQEPGVRTIVVADNGSTDASLDIARQHADVVLELPNITIGHLRNRGAAELSEVDVIGFVDADMVVGPRWLSAGLDALEQGADFVGSRPSAASEDGWIANRWAEIERHRVHAESQVFSGHLLIRRSVFEALNGFDPGLRTGEDADLSSRLRSAGYRVEMVPGMGATHHGSPRTVLGFIKRELWHTSTPGWFRRMAPKSRALVISTALWLGLGALAVGNLAMHHRARALVVWSGLSAAAVPAAGRAAGGSARNSVPDGLLLGLWSAVRALRLWHHLLTGKLRVK